MIQHLWWLSVIFSFLFCRMLSLEHPTLCSDNMNPTLQLPLKREPMPSRKQPILPPSDPANVQCKGSQTKPQSQQQNEVHQVKINVNVNLMSTTHYFILTSQNSTGKRLNWRRFWTLYLNLQIMIYLSVIGILAKTTMTWIYSSQTDWKTFPKLWLFSARTVQQRLLKYVTRLKLLQIEKITCKIVSMWVTYFNWARCVKN